MCRYRYPHAFVFGLLSLLCLWSGLPSRCLAQSRGFQLNHYEPTSAGEWSFWVDHPWYSSTRYFAAGFTLNYARAPFILGQLNPDGSSTRVAPIIAHQLLGHFDVAGSFLDRVNISFSLPVVLYEAGTARFGVTPQGAAVSDPRLGFMVRLFGQPDRGPVSLSVGSTFFVPLRHFTSSVPEQSSDSEFRAIPRLVLAGLPGRIRYSLSLGADIRSFEQLGTAANPDGSTTGTALQLGLLVHYADVKRRLAIGPELVFRTILNRGLAGRSDYSSLEMFITGHYNIGGLVQLGLAGGLGLLSEPGTPDGRFLFRIAYAPIRKEKPARVDYVPTSDRDGDRIPDSEDECPDAPVGPTPDAKRRGCPDGDRDRDGVFDSQDLCPDEPTSGHPDPQRRGCPAKDSDGDGVFDPEDRCPSVPAGSQPDKRAERLGCPAPDRDNDGVIDDEDACPDKHMSAHPSKLPGQKGCPATDRDFDGVYEPDDLCPDVPAGLHPDEARPGCPLPDRDGDSVPDSKDACPDKPGAPSTEPKQNGCPGLVEIKGGLLEIKQQIFFKTNSDEINTKKSLKVLEAVQRALQSLPQIKKIEIAGLADDKGSAAYNLDLTDRRAKSVRRWLIEHGVAEERLSAKGYGKVELVAGAAKKTQRERNRRVEFRLADPAPQPASPAAR